MYTRVLGVTISALILAYGAVGAIAQDRMRPQPDQQQTQSHPMGQEGTGRMVIISDDIGGKMRDYTTHFRQVRDTGEPVVIAGTCVSACTMVLGFVPSDRICATGNAVLGFHAAWMFDNSGKRVVSASGTQDLMNTYPASVRAWIARHGGLTPKMMYLRGRDLAAIVAPCSSSRVASISRTKRFGGVRQAADTTTPRASFDAR